MKCVWQISFLGMFTWCPLVIISNIISIVGIISKIISNKNMSKMRSYLNCYVNLVLKIRWSVDCWIDFEDCWINFGTNFFKWKYVFEEKIKSSVELVILSIRLSFWFFIGSGFRCTNHMFIYCYLDTLFVVFILLALLEHNHHHIPFFSLNLFLFKRSVCCQSFTKCLTNVINAWEQ